MHDRADLTHGLVDGSERRIDEGLEGSRVRLACSDLLLGCIQGHAGRKQLLDGKVVEVAPDAVALVQQCGHVLSVASRCKLKGKRGLGSEGFRERKLGAVELGCADLTEQNEDTGRHATRTQWRVQGRSEGSQLGDTHRLRARHRVHDHAGTLVQHAHRAAFGRES